MLHLRRPFVCFDLSRVLRGIALYVAAVTLLGAALPMSARSLIATCEDGSVIFAKKWQDVRCSGAVEVEPKDVPQFGHVPRDRAAERRAFNEQHEAMRECDLEAQLTALPAVAARARPITPALPLVALSAAENGDLARFVALSQEQAVVAIERGASPVQIRLAHSGEFEARLRADLAARGSSAPGPILLFSVEPAAVGLGATLPSFAQRGVTFRPQAMDPSQLGLLATLGRGAPRLGYVALPAGFDLARPLVVFWGDAVVAARLRR